MDFVHLDDIIVMFGPLCRARDAWRKRPKRTWSKLSLMAQECCDRPGVQVSRLGCSSTLTEKSGATNEQIRYQAFDAGNVHDGADRGAPAYPCPRCGR